LNRAPIETRNTLAIAVSQSGQSPDVVDPMRYFRGGAATTVALVNDIESPLAKAAEWAMPLHAGKEQSVAATKGGRSADGAKPAARKKSAPKRRAAAK